MTIRIWSRSGKYPNKHTGIYQNATGDFSESIKLSIGERVDLEHKLQFVFDESLLDQLATLGCLWTNINPPLVNGVIGEVLLEHAGSDIQLFRADIIAKDGETRDYYLVNIACSVHCLDYEKSIIDSFWDNGEPRGISKLRFKNDECMDGHAIARLTEYTSTILVSEIIHQALSKLKFKGLHFELDSDGDGYRF
jgi:hypothetical protein